MGSAQTVTNGEGQLYERLEYTPYGEVWLDESAAYVAGRNDFKTPFRFTAKELDPPAAGAALWIKYFAEQLRSD